MWEISDDESSPYHFRFYVSCSYCFRKKLEKTFFHLANLNRGLVSKIVPVKLFGIVYF